MNDKIKTELNEFDKKNKKKFFEGLHKLIEQENNNIEKEHDLCLSIGLTDFKAPNSSVTANNKIVEISHVFKNAGISMFSEYNEQTNTISFPLISEIILSDLIGKVHDSTSKFKSIYSLTKKTDKMLDDFFNEHKKVFENDESNLMKKIIFKSKKGYIDDEFELTFNDLLDKFYDLLDDYKKNDDEIFEYNLEKDLISSTKKYFSKNEYNNGECLNLLEEKIYPQLHQLSLDFLIAEFEEEFRGKKKK